MFEVLNIMFSFLYEMLFKCLVSFLKFVECLIIFLQIILKNVFLKLREFYKLVQNFLKTYCFVLIKTICFVILVLSGLSVTLDYLSYPYIYKLIVSDKPSQSLTKSLTLAYVFHADMWQDRFFHRLINRNKLVNTINYITKTKTLN